MSEPTPGPAHRREYRDEDGRAAFVDVDQEGLVVCTAEVMDELLIEAGFERVDDPPTEVVTTVVHCDECERHDQSE